MRHHRRPLADRTVSLLAEGYAWLPDRMRRAPDHALRTRVLGRQALALRGPEAVRFFYDERHVRRHGAVPEPVLGTLFGHGAVHTLDGEEHRVRKRMFLSLLTPPDRVADVAAHAAAAWDEAVASWARRPGAVVLFDEAAQVLTAAVCRWAGVPPGAGRVGAVAGDLVAMVDGFATLGPRHWRARRARRRCEAWLAPLVEEVRSGVRTAPEGSALAAVAGHRDAGGRMPGPRTAAVELLNVLRPTVAIAWYVAFAAHALHRWPANRDRLRAGDRAYPAAFVHELRRFYPFAPFSGGRAATGLCWRGTAVPAGGVVLLDIYGQNHDSGLWGDPYAFRPARFLERPAERDELIPQGGGDASAGHRCPGEAITVAVLETLVVRLARLEYRLPPQDLGIPLRRVPSRPRSGVLIELAPHVAP
ncbi:cytochrome P450 [Streptomyces aidingensis]|uniref:Fatty-acid peroxygenase n=1 Tax=Streptomyces aidingensis TaxID=910347 RepID=A0A1I1T1U3_9ACTN|nr:cytochrome P450 [Streptomyces aidingensis]SFD52647.1 fatty-acid peroxygenase [Streptomyces aidingensis]